MSGAVSLTVPNLILKQSLKNVLNFSEYMYMVRAQELKTM